MEGEEIMSIQLSRSQKKFQVLFENSPIGMAMVIHATGEFVEVNPSLLRSTGYTREEFLNLSFWDITPREYEQQELDQIEELNKKGAFGPNYKEYIRKDGSRYPIKISGFKLVEVDGTEVVWGLIEDISERVQMENELKALASEDYLTGLINRRVLVEEVEALMDIHRTSKKAFYYLILDIDKFKEVNDIYGHHFGDEVLKVIAGRMKEYIRRQSDLIARLGGDEFVLILTDIDHLPTTYIEDFLAYMNETIVIDGVGLNVLVSLGGATYPKDGLDYNTLYRVADHRLYEVKKQGGGNHII